MYSTGEHFFNDSHLLIFTSTDIDHLDGQKNSIPIDALTGVIILHTFLWEHRLENSPDYRSTFSCSYVDEK